LNAEHITKQVLKVELYVGHGFIDSRSFNTGRKFHGGRRDLGYLPFLAALRILASLLGSALANPDSFEVFPNRTELQT
jgi:hypothetical protein